MASIKNGVNNIKACWCTAAATVAKEKGKRKRKEEAKKTGKK